MRLKYFEHSAVFTQRVKLLSEATTITGELEFMVCDDSKCLPPEYLDFSFDIKKSDSPAKEKTTSIEEAEEKEESHDDESGIFNPVSWESSIESLGNDEYLLKATATIDDHWHLYSVNLPSDDGPIATEFNLLTKEGVEAIGETNEEGDLKTEYDPNFLMELSYFEGKATISKKVKVIGGINEILAEVYFMVCDDKRCLPPEAVEFTYKLEGASESAGTVSSESSDSSDESGDRSLLGIFLLSFLGGFAALLTPCVFPMIPMTVSFFTKQSKTKAKGISNAIFYGLSIIGIYTLLGFAITNIFGADALNALSTNFWFNIIFFVLLIVFAFSFLGAFEITLPSSWVNKADRASDKGGLIGIFFMATTLSLVSFSCTGPIIGTLLVDAAVHGGVSGPLIGMFGFSSALALPFALFAAFPGWLNSLPKSGGWLNSVKVVLGFLELGLAFKFLSNADLVVQAHMLTREMFIAVWIGVSGALTLYLLGFIRMPHDSPLEKLSVGRAVLGTFMLMFTVYLVPGLWGAPLKLISGFPPPMFYSESPNGVGYSKATVVGGVGAQAELPPEGSDPAHCPHNLNCFHDYETGMAYAKEVGKPVMLDFTGWACVNCRKMEEQVWSDPRVLERLRNDVVLISLYVDEKTKLPEAEQHISETTGKKVKTIGNKWSDFQAAKFGTNSQPYYVFLDHEGKQLHESAAYDPDIDLFVKWLDAGKKAFSASAH
jgi:thiol:disulfide interchange protein DsbD